MWTALRKMVPFWAGLLQAEVTGAIGPLLLRAVEEGGVESFAGSAGSQTVAEAAATAAAAVTLAALRDVVRTGKRSWLRWIGLCRRWTARW
jgi:hypothetical protein